MSRTASPTRASATTDMAVKEVAAPIAAKQVVGVSPGRRALRRFLRHRLAIVGLITIAVIALLAILGSEEKALALNLRPGYPNQPPGALADFPLGTDALG